MFLLTKKLNLLRKTVNPLCKNFATTTIVLNSYKFYVDFKGLLYFDDSTPFIFPNCIKDIKFITQFYKHLKATTKQGYEYQAEFWGQKNYMRCAISPVVFNDIDQNNNIRFSIQQRSQFKPDQLQLDNEGRIWHPYQDNIKGVFSNDLLTNFLEQVETKQDISYFNYKGKRYQIKNK